MGIAGFAARIFLLLLLVVADARLHDDGGLCMSAQQRLAKLRAEIKEAEQKAEAACSANVNPDALHYPAWVGELADTTAAATATAAAALSSTTTSVDRRRQTSGMAPSVSAYRLRTMLVSSNTRYSLETNGSGRSIFFNTRYSLDKWKRPQYFYFILVQLLMPRSIGVSYHVGLSSLWA